jgi:hypothetical protein
MVHRAIVAVRARFDGQDDPVSGSPVPDTIAYTRVNTHTISGTAKRNGNISIRETLTACPEGHALTLTYSVYRGAGELANGTAVFEELLSP